MPLFPSDTLFQQLRSRDVGGDKLEMLGKQASREWARGEHKDLSDAVVSVVKEAQLSPEQVKRVIEFTNTNAFLEEFRKEGSSHRYIDFGPDVIAHPNRVFQDLNDGSGGTVFDTGTGDYLQPVPSSLSKTGSAGVFEGVLSKESEEMWKEAFSSTPAPEEYANPFFELYTLKEKIASDYEDLVLRRSHLENMAYDLIGSVANNVKLAANEGHSLGEIIEIWRTQADDSKIKLAFDLVLPDIIDSGVFDTVDDVMTSFTKVAHVGEVNGSHPLVSHFREFCDVTSELEKTAAYQSEIAEHLLLANKLLSKVANQYYYPHGQPPVSAPNKKGVIGAIGGLWGKGLNLAGRGGESVGKALFGTDAYGNNKGKWVGGLAKTVGVVAPIVLADRVLSKSNVYRELKEKAKSNIPGTEAYYASQLEDGSFGGY